MKDLKGKISIASIILLLLPLIGNTTLEAIKQKRETKQKYEKTIKNFTYLGYLRDTGCKTEISNKKIKNKKTLEMINFTNNIITDNNERLISYLYILDIPQYYKQCEKHMFFYIGLAYSDIFTASFHLGLQFDNIVKTYIMINYDKRFKTWTKAEQEITTQAYLKLFKIIENINITQKEIEKLILETNQDNYKTWTNETYFYNVNTVELAKLIIKKNPFKYFQNYLYGKID